MFEQYLSHTFYNNTIQEWAISLFIILAAIVAGKICYWFFGKIIKKLTSKTKTKFDDIIIDMIEEPIVFAIGLAGIWYAVNILTFNDTIWPWIVKAYGFLIAINITWLIARVFDSIYKEYILPLAEKTETDLDDQLMPIIRKGTILIIWVLGVIIALNNAGYNVTALIAGLGIGGLALAMAAKDTIANIFGGFTVLTDKPFKVGDRIKVDGFDGSIKEIGIRSSRMQTLGGTIVTIPNSKFADSSVENITMEPSRKVANKIGLVYETTPEKMEKAMKLLNDIIDKNEDLLEDRLVSFTEFADFSMNILFIYYIKKGADIFRVMSDVHLEVLKQFNKNKLEFAFPTQTIYTKKG
jgi:MscS family membrane protein